VGEEPVAHEAGPAFLGGWLDLRQALQEWEAASIRLPKLHDTELAVAVDLYGLRRLFEQTPAQRFEIFVFANGGHPVVVGIDRDSPIEKAALEEADDKLAEEGRGLDLTEHAQPRRWKYFAKSERESRERFSSNHFFSAHQAASRRMGPAGADGLPALLRLNFFPEMSAFVFMAPPIV
ncbi:MAG TPA: hypothetical protein VIJ26_19225, partial [Thermoanaerobaculia bacterium]